MIRFVSLILLVASASAAPAATDAVYRSEVRPLLNRYCIACHSTAKHTGDIDLEKFSSLSDVLREPRVWQKVVEQLTLEQMPPKPLPSPSTADRAKMLAWVNAALATAARAHAGDPGPVVLRRLNNAEYNYTIRDLTGVSALDPAKEFPADGAAGEGFMNTGNALAMSPSLVTKYLDAGKAVAAHAMLLPDGIRFSASTSRQDWTDQLLAEIRAFYATFTEDGGMETVKQQGIALDKNRGGRLPLKRYITASLALRAPGASVAAVAKKHNLSPKYLAALQNLLQGGRPSPLTDPLRTQWSKASTAADVDAMVAAIGRWQETLWKFSSVGHIGKEDGPKAWMEPVDPVVERQELRLKLARPASGNDVTVYLAAHNAGDGATGDVVLWNPRIEIPGSPPVPLRDLPALAADLAARRARVFATTAASLRDPANADPAWADFLGLRSAAPFALQLLEGRIEKSGAYDFVQGWGSAKLPMLLANSSGTHVRVPGNMKPHAVAVHPSKTLKAAVGWRSPVSAALRVEGAITRAHAECGNGVTWALELRRGRTRQTLAAGEARGAKPVTLGPFERVRVQPGDMLSIFIGPREGNFSCALTDLDFKLSGSGADQWSLSEDVNTNVLAGNPHADRSGRAGVWHFYTEPVAGHHGDTMIPAGSLLARWQAAESNEERGRLAVELQRLLTSSGPAPGDTSPDALLYRQLNSLAGPLFAGASATVAAKPSAQWGLAPNAFGRCPDATPVDAASICVQAPSVLTVHLPADLVADAEFVAVGGLAAKAGAEGSVQLELRTTLPQVNSSGLLEAGTTVGATNGVWTSNNQTVDYSTPVVVNPNSAASQRVRANFEEFRQMFPAALCYTKIVPVDEVVTLTLFHREDDALSRLILNDKQKARLDKLWNDLHYISRDALTLVDAFEQLWQYATQDADPSKFEPLRKPIQDRAAAFRQHLLDTEPRHVDAVVEFAGRAYRRPLKESEATELRSLYRQLRNQEMPHEEAVRLLLARVLVSPPFLYRTEAAPAGKQAGRVGDYELATRLSYFLWSSLPDAELRAAAAGQKLRTVAGLHSQTHRMLRDARVRRLATEFGAAWLHIHDFENLDEKSERHFPTFRDLRAPMYEETIRFFTDFFANNRSVLDLLSAKHTFLNEALAKHYGIPGVTGDEWRRLDNIAQYGRGGILGHASVLAKQAGASRTSPILRGNWIMEVLLGERSPRPPKDVPQLPADESTENLTVRQMVEKHTSDPRCAGCHARFDPYGYTLERYDAIGARRDKDLGNRPINDRAKLRGGVEVQGMEGLRDYILTQGRDAFVRQFCRKLLGYSLGRAVQLSDEPLLDDMQARLAATGHHVGSAIDIIVASRQFREIRGRDHEPEQH
ncbi:MAG: DUF1592 domain-containing protein [Bryobacterales bacterium]|nr:DUF1592 domain-containing protein [Bryobacterales bacterium]